MHIFITGATGLIGSALIPHLLKNSYKITALSRRTGQYHESFSQYIQFINHFEQTDFSVFDAVINLAGEPIFAQHWNAMRKQVLWDSRVNLTQQLVKKINTCDKPPHTLISASAMGFYGDKGTHKFNESAPKGEGFAADLCATWEKAAQQAKSRVCLLRTANVLANNGGMLAKLLPLYRLGLGGKLGNGQQFMPWIHLNDMVGTILHLLHNTNCAGAYNVCSPHSVNNKTFNNRLAQVLHRPACLNVPHIALKLAFGERTTLLLHSQNAYPTKLIESGFQFQFPQLEATLADLLTTSK